MIHHNRRRVVILIVVSLLGIIAFGFTYRVIANGASRKTVPSGSDSGALAGY